LEILYNVTKYIKIILLCRELDYVQEAMRYMVAHQTPVGNTPVAHKKTNHFLLMMVSAAADPKLWKISE
jgi:hypothetical protein